MTLDLAAIARKRRSATSARLRGLGDAWRVAESALLADVAASPRRGQRAVARFAALARRSGEDEAIGRAARLRGSALSHAGRYAASVAAYRVAIRRLDGAARDGARVGLALSFTRMGRIREALRTCRQARDDAEARGDALLASAARMNEAVALHESGDPASAVPLYRAAREGFSGANQPRHAARAAEALANALALVDRFDEALPLHAEAAETLGRVGLAREAAVCRYNRGALLVALDRLGEADEELDAAEQALRDAGDGPNAALARLDRGEALLRAHLVPEARHLLRTALRSSEGRVPPVEAARGILLLARGALEAGDAAGARRILARQLPISTPRATSERTELMGRALASAGQFRDARRSLENAAKSAAHLRSMRARCLAAASWCATETGDLGAARRLAGVATRLASRRPVPGLRFAAAAALFSAEDRAGRTAAASAALAVALDALESLRGGLGPDAMRAAMLRGSEAWFARAVRHTLDAQGGEVALALLERWRARALVDLIADGERSLADADRGPAPPSSDAVRALRDRLAVLERRLAGDGLPAFLRSTSAPAVPRLVREVASAERALRSAAERAPAAAFAPPPDLGAFARSLPEGTLVLSLFADTVDGVAFAIDRRGVRVTHGLGRESEVASLVEELHFRMGKFALGPQYAARHATRLAAETDRALAALAERTLAPVAAAVRRARRLVIVPHGPWHRVPFAALPFDGAPLADRMPVACTPSLAALASRPRPATGPSLVVSSPDPQAPAISVEARRVAETIPGARLVEGDAATSNALAQDAAPAVLHVAAHGRFRDDAPAMSGVRLADGWFRACEFRRLRLDGSLVVLSGCETGGVRVEGAGEALGLVRGVLSAGASELVVSLWRVDDASTAEFMARLHAALAGGARTDEALRAAQNSLRVQGLHPWFWAGFGLWTRSLGSGI